MGPADCHPELDKHLIDLWNEIVSSPYQPSDDDSIAPACSSDSGLATPETSAQDLIGVMTPDDHLYFPMRDTFATWQMPLLGSFPNGTTKVGVETTMSSADNKGGDASSSPFDSPIGLGGAFWGFSTGSMPPQETKEEFAMATTGSRPPPVPPRATVNPKTNKGPSNQGRKSRAPSSQYKFPPSPPRYQPSTLPAPSSPWATVDDKLAVHKPLTFRRGTSKPTIRNRTASSGLMEQVLGETSQ